MNQEEFYNYLFSPEVPEAYSIKGLNPQEISTKQKAMVRFLEICLELPSAPQVWKFR